MGERIPLRTWGAIVLAFAGIAVMVSSHAIGGGWLGLVLSSMIALSFASATVIIRHRRGVRMTPAAVLASAFGALLALPFVESWAPGARDLGLMWLFGVGQLGIGMALFTTGARMVPAAEASLLTVLETLFASIWVWLAYGEDPGPGAVIGGVLVLAAVVGHTLADLRRPRAAAASV